MFGGFGGGNRVHVTVTADNKQLDKELKQSEKAVGKFAKSTESRLGKTAGFMKTGFAAAGGAALAKFTMEAVNRAEAMNSAYAITEQVISQTGGAANVTAQEVKNLAKEQSNLTAVDKQLVTEGANVILTFKGIRNEAGEGNDVFTRTNKLMLDVAATMGTDAKSAAMQLGKALNDPLANMGALSRAGLTFTTQQKEQIKALVESGNLLEAQKLILGELESQLGGTAAASADASDKIGNVFKEALEAAGGALLEGIEPLADFTQWLDSLGATSEKTGERFSVLNLGIRAFTGIFGVISLGKDAFDELFGAATPVPEALDRVRRSAQLARGPQEDLAASVSDVASAMREQRDEALRLASPTVNLLRAQEDAVDAQEAYDEAIRNGSASSRDAKEAAIDLMKANAELDAAASVFATEGGQASIDALVENLRVSGIWNETIAALIEQIRTLNNTPIRSDLAPTRPAGGHAAGETRFHTGGRVNAPRGQEVPAVLLGGETVVAGNGGGGAGILIQNVYGWDDFVEKVREAGLDIGRTDGTV